MLTNQPELRAKPILLLIELDASDEYLICIPLNSALSYLPEGSGKSGGEFLGHDSSKSYGNGKPMIVARLYVIFSLVEI